jgi:DNA-binding beta-propeller fold protein YncE
MEDKGLMGSARTSLDRAIVLAGAIAVLCASLALGAGSPSPPSIGFVDEWGESGSGPGEFGFPVSVAVHGTGNVYVADSENDRIQRFDESGAFLREWGGSGNGPGQFATPEAVEVDNFGNVYVADKGNYRIQKFTPTGGFVSQWGSQGAGAGQFEEPEGLATDYLGNVYVADAGNNRIEKFSPSGTFIAQWGGAGKAAGQFNDPSGVAVGKEGYVYVADSGNDRIQKFTEAGTFVSKWGKTGADPGELDFPTAVASDSAGRVFVADTVNDRIERFDDSGKFLDEWGVHGKASGQFDSPVSLSVAGGGKVYVADAGNNRIQVFGKLPKPVYGKSFNVGTVSGVVRVHLPGTTKFIVLGADQQLPVGTIVDTNHGRVRLSSSKGPGGGTQSADFFSGTFRVLQPKGGKPITVLKLENAIVCPAKGKRELGALARSKNRGLWGSGKGNFRSEGKHGSATVRGTIWWAQDTCKGTLFKVKRGVVTIAIFSTGQTLKLHAGQRYLAPNG